MLKAFILIVTKVLVRSSILLLLQKTRLKTPFKVTGYDSMSMHSAEYEK